MIDHEYKEVYFHAFCKKCKYADVKDTKDPCNECLSEPTNIYSHRPVKFEEKPKKARK